MNKNEPLNILEMNVKIVLKFMLTFELKNKTNIYIAEEGGETSHYIQLDLNRKSGTCEWSFCNSFCAHWNPEKDGKYRNHTKKKYKKINGQTNDKNYFNYICCVWDCLCIQRTNYSIIYIYILIMMKILYWCLFCRRLCFVKMEFYYAVNLLLDPCVLR